MPRSVYPSLTRGLWFRCPASYPDCMPAPRPSVASRILKNSAWYGLEQVLEAVIFFGTSIAVARYLGPEKLGYYQYINFFVQVVTRTSGSGLAGATRKYMVEFLAQDKPGTAHAVYKLAYRFQVAGALLITALGLAAVAWFGQPGYRLMASLLILSIVPGILSWIPAMANLAFEDLSRNTLSALAYIFSYTTTLVLTLYFHWGLVGIASALLLGRTVEVILRTGPLHRRLAALPLDTLDAEIKLRIRRFCLEALGLQLLMSVVWDRSEMIFLKHFSGLEQIAFYSVSYSLTNNLLLAPRTFGGATSVSLMAEASRSDRDHGDSRVDSIVKNASRYLLLVSLPIHIGAAAIAGLAVTFTYGAKYAAAVPVLVIASLLAIPRAFQEMPETLLRAADRQKQLLIWYSITGVLNIALDFLFIPRFGAVGAAWGNGLAQAAGVVFIWFQARRFYTFSLPPRALLRLGLSACIMGSVAYSITRALPTLTGLLLAMAAGAAVYMLSVKSLHGLEASDRQRLAPIGNRFPDPMRRAYLATLTFLIPAKA